NLVGKDDYESKIKNNKSLTTTGEVGFKQTRDVNFSHSVNGRYARIYFAIYDNGGAPEKNSFNNISVKISHRAPEFSGGNGRQGNPYILVNRASFDFLANQVNNNVVSHGYENTYFKVVPAGGNGIDFGNTLFARIGNWDRPFQGNLDGNGCILQKLNIDTGSGNEAGLIGCLINGTVSNLTVEGSVKGKDNVGGIAGYSTGTITNCTNKMIVTGSNNNIGGIAGYSTGTITNCTNGANVEGNAAVGGIVGKADGAGNVISGCSNTGAITSRGTLEDKKNGIVLGAYLGGIAGLTYGDINHCYNGNTVAVKSAYGNSDIVGGIVGQSTSTISYCANIGIVRGSNKVGGIAGYKTSDTSYCYNTGKIEKLYNGFAGGIIGEKAGGTVTNCWALYTGEKPTTN
ncbi:MAG: GLUG motif-containing protein, partial [Clostridia bacterium]